MVDLAAGGYGAPWRFVAVQRYPSNRSQGDLSDARSRQLVFQLRAPNSLSFAISGRSSQLGWLEELRSDVVAYRWSDSFGDFVPMFRGCITQSEDQISPTVHTVTMTASDYRAILNRRAMRNPENFQNVEQYQIALQIVGMGDEPLGTPTGRLGLASQLLNPDGSSLAATGIVRVRVYLPGQLVGDALDNMATDINGFEYSVDPAPTLEAGMVASFYYPQRGTTRSTWVAHYGSTVTDLSRVISTTQFANYSMVIGAPADSSSTVNQFVESTTGGFVDPVDNPEGPWMTVTSEPQVSQLATLQQDSDGFLVLYGDLEPAYNLTLAPGTWSPSDCWLGDTVRLIVNSGRLEVDTAVRITAVSISIDDNGRETAVLTAGIPPPDAGPLIRNIDRRLSKLELR